MSVLPISLAKSSFRLKIVLESSTNLVRILVHEEVEDEIFVTSVSPSRLNCKGHILKEKNYTIFVECDKQKCTKCAEFEVPKPKFFLECMMLLSLFLRQKFYICISLFELIFALIRVSSKVNRCFYWHYSGLWIRSECQTLITKSNIFVLDFGKKLEF